MKKYFTLLLLLIMYMTPLYSSWYCKTTIPGSFNGVEDVQFDNSKIIMSTATRVSRWNIETGDQIDSFENNFKEESVVNNYLGDKDKLFVIAQTGERKLINLQTKKAVWQEPAIPKMFFAKIDFNDDKSRLLLQSRYKGMLVDTQSGKIKTILWDNIFNDQPGIQTFAQFLPKSCDIVVIHNGWLNNAHNDGVEYKNVIPADNVSCALFSPESNRLVYCYPSRFGGTIALDDLLAHWSRRQNNISHNNVVQQNNNDSAYSCIVDMITGKNFVIKGRKYTIQMFVSLQDDGKKLLCSSFSPMRRGDYEHYSCYIDLFNLEKASAEPELTIPCDSEPYCKVVASSKNLLFLGMLKKCELWDTSLKMLLCSFAMAEWPAWIAMNSDCNQLAIVEKDHVAIWQKQENALVTARQISNSRTTKEENKYNNFSSLCCFKALESLYKTFCCDCCFD